MSWTIALAGLVVIAVFVIGAVMVFESEHPAAWVGKIVIGAVLFLSILFGLVKFIKWAWGF